MVGGGEEGRRGRVRNFIWLRRSRVTEPCGVIAGIEDANWSSQGNGLEWGADGRRSTWSVSNVAEVGEKLTGGTEG